MRLWVAVRQGEVAGVWRKLSDARRELSAELPEDTLKARLEMVDCEYSFQPVVLR